MTDQEIRAWLGPAWAEAPVEKVRQAYDDALAISAAIVLRDPLVAVLQVLGSLSSWEVPWPDPEPVVGWPELRLCPAAWGPGVDLEAPIFRQLGHVRCVERNEWVATGDLQRHQCHCNPYLVGL